MKRQAASPEPLPRSYENNTVCNPSSWLRHVKHAETLHPRLTRKVATLMRRAAPPMERRGASRSRPAAPTRLGSPPSASGGSAVAAASRRASVFGNMERGVHATMEGTVCTGRLSA